MVPRNKSGAITAHLNDHINYPATKQEIIHSCANMSDVPDDVKDWVVQNLPDKTYQDAGEVKSVLNLE